MCAARKLGIDAHGANPHGIVALVRHEHFYAYTQSYFPVFLECQKSDWSAHKRACRPLEKGTWVTLTFCVHMPGANVPHPLIPTLTSYRASDPLNQSVDIPREGEGVPPRNVHSANPFLVKIQLPVDDFGRVERGGTILIYDRQKSIVGYVTPSMCSQEYARVTAECTARGKVGGLKMYRWAKRAGPLQLSVCLDIEPDEEVRW